MADSYQAEAMNFSFDMLKISGLIFGVGIPTPLKG